MDRNSNSESHMDDETNSLEEIEQICRNIHHYDPCFRVSMISHHLQRLGVSCNDERIVKLVSLSFETILRNIVTDCALIEQQQRSISDNSTSSTFTTNTLIQALTKNEDVSLSSLPSTIASIPQSSLPYESENMFDL
ncbi:unnamed protein product [Didymodactylos carnosus]|uniref:Uncharacterized protein n=1 Tax=Didymodactylos carnosus TaxID=1234261 RepID=A0A814F9Z9_9BILA|nr:unnamed protein product [Didymodactylos carnosus]CAF3755412.1 unnamed protein product [Didymodactylos carnosus]